MIKSARANLKYAHIEVWIVFDSTLVYLRMDLGSLRCVFPRQAVFLTPAPAASAV